MKTKLAVLLLCFLAAGGSAFAQVNNARMLSTPNAQTGTSYTFVPADTTRVVTFSNASAVAVSLPNGATVGFGPGNMFSVVNLGAGTVTITCASCTINGSATLVLAQGQGADIYGGVGVSPVNYAALASPTGTGNAILSGNNLFTGNNTFSQPIALSGSAGTCPTNTTIFNFGAFSNRVGECVGNGTLIAAFAYDSGSTANGNLVEGVDSFGGLGDSGIAATNVVTLAGAQNVSNKTFTTPPVAGGTPAPISAGSGACATDTNQVGGAGAGSLKCTAATGASSFTITPGISAPNGWFCSAQDLTTVANKLNQSGAISATACTISGTVNQNDFITWTAVPF